MIYEDIMLVRANGISEALLSTGAFLPEGGRGVTLFFSVVRVNWIACGMWASRCKLGALAWA